MYNILINEMIKDYFLIFETSTASPTLIMPHILVSKFIPIIGKDRGPLLMRYLKIIILFEIFPIIRTIKDFFMSQ